MSNNLQNGMDGFDIFNKNHKNLGMHLQLELNDSVTMLV